MRFLRHMLVVAAVAVLVSGVGSVSGQNKAAPDEKAAAATANLVSDLGLAAQLAEFGRGGLNERDGLSTKTPAPEALVAAGALLLRTHKLTGGKMGTIADAPKEGGKAAPAVPLDKQAEALFDEARAAAGTNSKAVEALIEAAMKRDYDRGSVNGPSTTTRTLNPGETHTFNFNFYVGQPAAVAMTSTGPARIQFDLVHAGNGQSLLSIRGHNANYNWTPIRAKDNVRSFTVTLNNTGARPTTYTLTKN